MSRIDVKDRRAADMRLFIFYLSHRLVRVCHMGKINGNLDLVCEISLSCMDMMNSHISTCSTVKPVLSRHLKIDITKVLMENGSDMK